MFWGSFWYIEWLSYKSVFFMNTCCFRMKLLYLVMGLFWILELRCAYCEGRPLSKILSMYFSSNGVTDDVLTKC